MSTCAAPLDEPFDFLFYTGEPVPAHQDVLVRTYERDYSAVYVRRGATFPLRWDCAKYCWVMSSIPSVMDFTPPTLPFPSDDPLSEFGPAAATEPVVSERDRAVGRAVVMLRNQVEDVRWGTQR